MWTTTLHTYWINEINLYNGCYAFEDDLYDGTIGLLFVSKYRSESLNPIVQHVMIKGITLNIIKYLATIQIIGDLVNNYPEAILDSSDYNNKRYYNLDDYNDSSDDSYFKEDISNETIINKDHNNNSSKEEVPSHCPSCGISYDNNKYSESSGY
jgi:hypothetical protein